MAYQQRRRRNRGGIDPTLMLLLMKLFAQVQQMPYKPPATLFIMGVNIAVHLNDTLIPFSISSVCLHPAQILFGWDLKRLVLSAFVHADDYHLYYNMSSLLWKGAQLEQTNGTEEFLKMSAFLLLGSHVIYVLVAWILSMLGVFSATMQTCAVGYSAVLFGYKMVLNYNSPSLSSFYGMMVPLKYMCWVELVLISIITPNASFLGHLCGILAGLCYLKKEAILSTLGIRASRIQRGNLRPPPPRTGFQQQHNRWRN
mmetsp:Transcript_9287/g.15075  ORF Transcript_9287/g.15075 Transcript_9287/m.15075 type:complete len:256 (+) Transcript_9287:3-770(+)